MDLEQHLIELSGAAGPSGYEGPVCDLIQQAWDGLADDFEVDALGNLIAVKRGLDTPARRLLVTAHMDEIGLMVSRIEGAFLRVVHLGGIDRRALLNQPVIVHGERPLPGLIGSRPPHVLAASERGRFPPLDELVIDVGLPEREVRRLVSIGAPVTFDQQASALGDGVITGKALDNRASIAALTAFLHALQGRACRWDVAVVAAVQEELNHQGGTTSTWRTEPDIAVVVDTTWAIGVGVGDDYGFPLGGGLAMIVGPNAHPKLFDMLRELAKKHEVPIASEPATGRSGTDGWVTQISREGIPTAILEIPIRNMHTPVEIVAIRDIERAARLLAELAASLDDDTLGRLGLDAEE